MPWFVTELFKGYEALYHQDGNYQCIASTTMLAGINKREIEYLKTRCPELDLLSVQVYGGLAKVPQQLRTVATLYKYIRYIEKNKKQNQRKTKRNECLTHKI